jgi:hypothetical protein
VESKLAFLFFLPVTADAVLFQKWFQHLVEVGRRRGKGGNFSKRGKNDKEGEPTEKADVWRNISNDNIIFVLIRPIFN